MSRTVISVENLSKHYRLGVIGGATFREEFSRYWAKKLGRPDPYARIGEAHHGNRNGEHIWALRDVNLEVKEGEILGVIGRNGAGKSTLLKILSRITAPTSGRAVIRGRVGSLLEVGTGFHPELTGRENIYLNGTILGMTRAEVARRLDEIVEFAEMGQFIDTPVKRYSSGMTVRLAFSVAAHLEPEVLIVDEVLAVGDAAFQNRCLEKMQDVGAGGRTVLFVSHNMNAISRLCSRCVLISYGTVDASGSPRSMVGQYIRRTAEGKPFVLFDRNRRHRGDSAARFLSISMTGSGTDGAEMATVCYEGRLCIVVEIDAVRRVSEVNVAVIIHDSTGARIIDLNLAKAQQRLRLDKGGIATVEFVVDRLQLSDGIYTVSLWMGVGGVTTHDAIDAATRFVVLDNERATHSEVFPGAYSPSFEVSIESRFAS